MSTSIIKDDGSNSINIYNIMIYTVIGGLFSVNVWDSLATIGK